MVFPSQSNTTLDEVLSCLQGTKLRSRVLESWFLGCTVLTSDGLKLLDPPISRCAARVRTFLMGLKRSRVFLSTTKFTSPFWRGSRCWSLKP